MKYVISSICATLFIFSCNNINAGPAIYIENHYGATIKYKAVTNGVSTAEIEIKNLARSLVGTYPEVSNISIRTTGTGSTFLSPFTDLKTQLNQIKNEELADRNRGKDAVIIIKPSRSFQNWDIEVRWEKSGQELQTFEKDEEMYKLQQQSKEAAERAQAARRAMFGSAPTATKDTFLIENKLNRIMHGSFGPDYAQKARAINDYDYTKATSKGMQNLRTNLLKRIEETLEQTYQMESRRTGEWQAPALATDTELKENIDMLYRTLQRYKSIVY